MTGSSPAIERQSTQVRSMNIRYRGLQECNAKFPAVRLMKTTRELS